ncbi:MAG: hypothetical protein CMJ48_01520 [Planctomycetaceae bacterium]|nr:hypothetical protein [Planctomycetaceae bacterium]
MIASRISNSNKRESLGGSSATKDSERATRICFLQNSIGEPLRRRLRIDPSLHELRVDAKAEVEGASLSVEPSGGPANS